VGQHLPDCQVELNYNKTITRFNSPDWVGQYAPEYPQRIDTIIIQMIEMGQLQRIITNYHGYPQTRYLPLEKANLKELKGSEKEILDKVIEQFSDWSAAALTSYSHKDMPWLASKKGEVINYELVFYREAPYSVRNYVDEIEVQ